MMNGMTRTPTNYGEMEMKKKKKKKKKKKNRMNLLSFHILLCVAESPGRTLKSC
jgi:hypothetical protein